MDLKYQNRVTKTIIYFISAVIAALIQNTAGLTLEIGGARCFILIPLCIILGMGEDEFFAGMLGLFGGLLWDTTSSVHLGFNAVFLCIACYLSAAAVNYIVRDTFITAIVFSITAIFIYSLLYWLFFIIIKGVSGAELTLFSFYIPCAVYTSVITPIVWICASPIKKKLTKESFI